MTRSHELNCTFSAFDGGTGRLLSFGGLQTLAIEFSREDRLFTAYFGECRYIAGPVFWDDVRLRCSPLGENMLVEDVRAGVKIICYLVECNEFMNNDDNHREST